MLRHLVEWNHLSSDRGYYKLGRVNYSRLALLGLLVVSHNLHCADIFHHRGFRIRARLCRLTHKFTFLFIHAGRDNRGRLTFDVLRY